MKKEEPLPLPIKKPIIPYQNPYTDEKSRHIIERNDDPPGPLPV